MALTKVFFPVVIIVVLAVVAFYTIVPAPDIPSIQISSQEMYIDLFGTASYVTVGLPVGMPYSGHAIEKHKGHALRAEDCGFNPQMTLYNPVTNRFADLCQTASGKFGAFIYELENNFKREVSAFEKDKMTRLDQVLRYMTNQGYGEVPAGTQGIIQ